MKKIMFMAMVVAIVMASCENGIGEEDTASKGTAKVSVNFSGFDIETTTRADSAYKAGVDSISFAVIDEQGLIVYDKKLKCSKETSDSVVFELTMGTYTFVAEADKGKKCVIIGVEGGKAIANISGSTVFETFTASKQVKVAAGKEVNEQMTLKRVSAQLNLVTKDNQPEDVKKLQILIGDTLKPAYTSFCIDLATGTMADFGTTGHLAREWTRGTGDADKPTTQSCALLLPAEQQSLPVKIAALDASGAVIRSHTISSVPFKQNCVTTITGEFYRTPAGGSFLIDTDWGTSIDGGW